MSHSSSLRLDSLPFPPSHFDFVRVAGIGLGVPEDEVRESSHQITYLSDIDNHGALVAVCLGGIYLHSTLALCIPILTGSLLKDIARVMKPGGVLEVREFICEY